MLNSMREEHSSTRVLDRRYQTKFDFNLVAVQVRGLKTLSRLGTFSFCNYPHRYALSPVGTSERRIRRLHQLYGVSHHGSSEIDFDFEKPESQQLQRKLQPKRHVIAVHITARILTPASNHPWAVYKSSTSARVQTCGATSPLAQPVDCTNSPTRNSVTFSRTVPTAVRPGRTWLLPLKRWASEATSHNRGISYQAPSDRCV